MNNIRIKLNIKKVSIDETGTLHIYTEREEILYRSKKSKMILLDNSFPYLGSMHTLFLDEKDPKRMQLLETYQNK
jgi:hypothetical protein